jgi:hypothetical protein
MRKTLPKLKKITVATVRFFSRISLVCAGAIMATTIGTISHAKWWNQMMGEAITIQTMRKAEVTR